MNSLAATPLPTSTVWHRVTPIDVHKSRAGAALLRHWTRVEPDQFAVRASWPGRHCLFCPEAGGRAPVLTLVVESVRQIGIAIPHLAYGVPRSSAFAMSAIDGHLTDGILPGRHLGELVADVTATDVVLAADGRLRSMTIVVTFLTGSEVIAHGTGSLVVLPAESYARLRGGRGGTPLASTAVPLSATSVGRLRGRDVVLGSRGPGDLRLRVAPAHPWFFDHVTDHLPGMVLVEAAQQALLSSGPLVPTSLRAKFLRYAELDADVLVTSEPRADGLVVDFTQAGATVATVEVGGRIR